MNTVIDSAGKIQLPEALRTQWGLKSGDAVTLEERNGEWILRPASDQPALAWEGNVLVYNGTVIGPVENLVEELRDERDRQLLSGETS